MNLQVVSLRLGNAVAVLQKGRANSKRPKGALAVSKDIERRVVEAEEKEEVGEKMTFGWIYILYCLNSIDLNYQIILYVFPDYM